MGKFNIETYISPNLQTTNRNPIGAINEVNDVINTMKILFGLIPEIEEDDTNG